ncbi:MAG: hypothetical protein RR356_05185 [Bacteroidales bacterium]
MKKSIMLATQPGGVARNIAEDATAVRRHAQYSFATTITFRNILLIINVLQNRNLK